MLPHHFPVLPRHPQAWPAWQATVPPMDWAFLRHLLQLQAQATFGVCSSSVSWGGVRAAPPRDVCVPGLMLRVRGKGPPCLVHSFARCSAAKAAEAADRTGPRKRKRQSKPSYVIQIMQAEGQILCMEGNHNLLNEPLLLPAKIVRSTSAADICGALRTNFPVILCRSPAPAAGAPVPRLSKRRTSLIALCADSLAANHFVLAFVATKLLPTTPLVDGHCPGLPSKVFRGCFNHVARHL